MKKVFLLALTLCGGVIHADDMAMNCGQQGFQVGVGFGYGMTTPTNTVYEFAGGLNTPGAISEQLQKIIDPSQAVENDVYTNPGPIDVTGGALDYSNLSPWQSMSSILASFNLGYKTFFDCNKYSVTGTAFIMMNGTSMTSSLQAENVSFQAQIVEATQDDPSTVETQLIGSVSSNFQDAGKLKLTSGAVFGFNVLLAKEFSWGNAGLLLGMKFNPFKLSYLQTDLQDVTGGYVSEPGYVDMTGETNNNVDLKIAEYTYSKTKTRTATGFTVGFATNYYISDNLSAGLTLFYDMYTPITFNLEDLDVSPFVYADNENQVTDSGKIKFQNNTIGVMMNLTYSFGAN